MKPRRVHMIGIGGIGMSGIAEILVHSGYQVTGSDLKENDQVRRLRDMGVNVQVGHRSENLVESDAVVFSSAVSPDNPEIIEARRRDIPLMARAEMLAEIMRKKKSIVVSGAHGKTTTSAMIATMLMEAGFDPTAVIGGRLRSIASNARMGWDEWFVAESDESDGSFLHLIPHCAVITNLDREHMAHYGTYEKLEQSFVDFANRVPFDGRVILCKDDPRARIILPKIERPLTTYGLESEADVEGRNWSVTEDGLKLDLFVGPHAMKGISLPFLGRHNLLNALAAVAVGRFLEIPLETVVQGLKAFQGIDRRLEKKGEKGGVQVYDDYAHHPTEIRETLRTLRKLTPRGALRVVFQPHRYSRLKELWDDFVQVFDDADAVILTPVYAASEEPLKGIDSQTFRDALKHRNRTKVSAVDSLESAASQVAEEASPGDLIITMGAGDITSVGPNILNALKKSNVISARSRRKK